jgi:hypothetical protein
VVGLLETGDFPSAGLDALAAVEDGLLQLRDGLLVPLDLFDVLRLNGGLLALDLLVLPLQADYLEAEVVKLFLHFLALLQLLPQLGHGFVLLDALDVGGPWREGGAHVLPSIFFHRFIISSIITLSYISKHYSTIASSHSATILLAKSILM